MARRKIVALAALLCVVLSWTAWSVSALRPGLMVVGFLLIGSAGCACCEVVVGSDVGFLERLLVAIGLTLIVPIAGGLILSLIGVRLDRISWLAFLSVVVVLCDCALLIRAAMVRSPARTGQRSGSFSVPIAAAIAFGISIVVAAGAVGLARVGAARERYPGFTELWLSPTAHNATVASLSVVNHQGVATSYRLVLFRRGRSFASWKLSLADGQTWHVSVSVLSGSTTVADLYRLPDTRHAFRQVSLHS